jgi:hypothetical protein
MEFNERIESLSREIRDLLGSGAAIWKPAPDRKRRFELFSRLP